MFEVTVMLAFLSMTGAECPADCRCTTYRTWCFRAKLGGLPGDMRNTTEHLVIEYDSVKELTTEMFHRAGLDGLRTLVLNFTKTETVGRAAFQNLDQLKTLEISHNPLDSIQPGILQGLHNLTTLRLSHNKIRVLNSRAIRGPTMLKLLDLSNNRITNLTRDSFDGMKCPYECRIEGDSRLPRTHRRLDLSCNNIEHIEPGTFQGLCIFTELDLRENVLCVLQPNVFLGLTALRSLVVSAVETSTQIGLVEMEDNSTLSEEMEDEDYFHLSEVSESNEYEFIVLRKDSFRGLETLEDLDVSYSFINFVESCAFENLKALSELYLNENKMRNVSSAMFRGLAQLTLLDLSYNSIEALQRDTFQEVPTLEVLNLSDNKIEVLLPGTFQSLARLQRLSILSGRIHTIHGGAFRGLSRLRVLHLIGNNVHSLTQDVFTDLVGLKHLEMRDNKIECVEAETFDSLRSVESLILSHNNITTIHNNTFRHLVRLNFLDLRHNEHLVVQLGGLDYLHVVKMLGLSAPRTEDMLPGDGAVLQDSLKPVYSVQKLRLSGISYELQPGAFAGLNLFSLVISDSHILSLNSEIFKGLSMLTSLSIGFANVGTIHVGAFQRLRSLITLRLGSNAITSFVPGVFHGLSNLEKLYLSNNLISSLDEGVFGAVYKSFCASRTQCEVYGALTNLEHLYLSANNITFIHPRTFVDNKHLQTLDLSYNPMLTLESHFLDIPSLQYLELSYCSIREVSLYSLRQVPKLATLAIAGNRIRHLDIQVVKQLAHLETVALAYNLFACDCELQELWHWIEGHKIRLQYEPLNLFCSGVQATWDTALSDLECNSSVSISEFTVRTGDFHFFKEYVEPTILGSILLAGVLGNGFLLFIFVQNPEVRSGANVCILNLAIGDLLSLVVNLPLSYWSLLHGSWDLGLSMCKLFMGARDLTVGVTVFSVVVLSAQRYVVVVRSFRKERGVCGLNESKTNLMYFLAVWGPAFGFSLPAFLTATVDTRCLYSPPGDEYIRRTWTIQLFTYCIVPVLVITALSVRTAHHLKTSVQNMPGERSATPQAEGRVRVANMVVVLTVVFCVSYVPNFLLRVLFTWSVIDHESDLTFFISFVSFCLFFCNSCFNPIALFYTSTTFRTLFLKYVQCGQAVNIPPEEQLLPQDTVPLKVFCASRNERLARIQTRMAMEM